MIKMRYGLEHVAGGTGGHFLTMNALRNEHTGFRRENIPIRVVGIVWNEPKVKLSKNGEAMQVLIKMLCSS